MRPARFVLGIASLVLLSVPAVAQSEFSCRASLVRVVGEGPLSFLGTIEPFVANPGASPCATDSAGPIADGQAITLPGGLGSARLLYASTTAGAQSAAAESGVAQLVLAVPGAPVVTADVLTSQATGECVGDQPRLSSSSRVVRVAIGGTVIEPVTGQREISLGPAGTLWLNQTVTEPNRVTQRALFLDTPLADVVVAESVADVTGNPCALVGGPGGICNVVADNTSQMIDTLSEVDTADFNPATNERTVGPVTGAPNMNVEAISFRPGTGVLYGADKDLLGTIDRNTGAFRVIGEFGSGDGALGHIRFYDNDGLTFDPDTGRLYGSFRREGPDVLIEIDPETGSHVPGAFGGDDYVVIEPTSGNDDVDGIAIGGRPSDREGNRFPMWAIANEGGRNDQLVQIVRSGDQFSGATRPVGPTGQRDMEGLQWDQATSILWGTTGKLNDTEALWEINPDTGAAHDPRVLDNHFDYEGVACPPA